VIYGIILISDLKAVTGYLFPVTGNSSCKYKTLSKPYHLPVAPFPVFLQRFIKTAMHR